MGRQRGRTVSYGAERATERNTMAYIIRYPEGVAYCKLAEASCGVETGDGCYGEEGDREECMEGGR